MTDQTIITNKGGMTKLLAANVPEDITIKTGQQQQIEVSSDDMVIKGKTYHNIKCLSNSSGEAQVYLVTYGKKEYVLKLYYPNCRLDKKVSKVIYNMNFEMVIDIVDFGFMYVDGNKRDYELMEYLQGGTLAEYNLEHDIRHFRLIALQCAAALHFCHTRRIIHKDIKPSNFFFRDEQHSQVVLGDFGISSYYDIENNGKIHTTQARTPTYAAPEMYSNVIDGEVEITPAVDYYSLGMTLFALWLGQETRVSDERKMMRQKSEGHLPRINELPEQVKTLIQGLTTVNVNTRWKYEEVEKWFNGEDVSVDISSPFLRYNDFVVDPEKNLIASNPKEMAQLLFENPRLGISYLYNHKVSQWLENCGNNKIALEIETIVNERYPVDENAGLTASIYALDDTFPYHDINGDMCSDKHSVCLSLLHNIEKYALQLTDPGDPLFLYLEARSDCDVNRLRSYFKNKGERVNIIRMIYEVDSDMPFLARYPSSTIKEITHSFGYCDCSDDDWQSLCDGRLFSWMYSHSDKMACESLRILTEGAAYSRSFAYKVLYNVDRDASFDLKDANSPDMVGELMDLRLQECQNLNTDSFKEKMYDYIDPDGRLAYYAQIHGWYDYVSEAKNCFDLESDDNRNRMGAYDIQTAAYRFCRMFGVIPKYKLDELTVLSDGRRLSKNNIGIIRHEIRSGNFIQWMSIFYHEDPFADFSETYSYERTLEKWIMRIGDFDMSQKYYKRFVAARKETDRQTEDATRLWNQASNKELIWNYLFYALCILWMVLLVFVGITPDGRRYLMDHTVFSIGVPLGLCSALIVAVHSYFRGYGFTISSVLSVFGFMTAAIPIMILREINKELPALFTTTIVIITVGYAYICYKTNYRNKSVEDKATINRILDDDVKSSLLEPLYFTFKTKSYKYISSKFGMIQDVNNHIRSMSGESVIHYMCWCLLVAVFIIDFIIYNPGFIGKTNPKLPTWRVDYQELVEKIRHDIE